MAGSLGTGMFNLPFRIKQIGINYFLLYISFAALFSYIGCLLLYRLIKATSLESYGKISEKAFGPKMKRLSQLCLVLFPWGITICYQVIMPKFIT
jgi:amino acid permease